MTTRDWQLMYRELSEVVKHLQDRCDHYEAALREIYQVSHRWEEVDRIAHQALGAIDE